MKQVIFFFLLLLSFSARASTVVGLFSENLVAWSVWEQEGPQLKQYLLVYNDAPQEIRVKIKFRRYKANTNFQVVDTSTTFYQVRLKPHQFVQLKYPRKPAPGVTEYLEYFEDGKSVGLLPSNTSKPAAAVLKKQYRFYSNQGANAGEMGYWVAFTSIYKLPKQLEITVTDPLRGGYHLVKLHLRDKDVYQRPGQLDSLARTDTSIIRLDSTHRSAVVPVDATFSSPYLTKLAVQTERIESSFSYDEKKRRPEKSVSGAVHFLPIFHENQE